MLEICYILFVRDSVTRHSTPSDVLLTLENVSLMPDKRCAIVRDAVVLLCACLMHAATGFQMSCAFVMRGISQDFLCLGSFFWCFHLLVPRGDDCHIEYSLLARGQPSRLCRAMARIEPEILTSVQAL